MKIKLDENLPAELVDLFTTYKHDVDTVPGTHPGVVIIRLRDPSRRRLIERLRQILQTESIETWRGCFVVIGEKRLRVRHPP